MPSNVKCPQCGLINFADAAFCKRCRAPFGSSPDSRQYAVPSTEFGGPPPPPPSPFGQTAAVMSTPAFGHPPGTFARQEPNSYPPTSTPDYSAPDAASSGSIAENEFFQKMMVGAVIFAIGLGLTFYSYSGSIGGRYSIFYGAMIVGGFRFFRGLYGMVFGD